MGEVTGPIQSDFGQHLILVKETRIAENPTLDQIRDDLAAEIENAAVEAKVQELTEAATITREGDLDLPLLVNLQISGNATNGVDYQSIASTLAATRSGGSTALPTSEPMA